MPDGICVDGTVKRCMGAYLRGLVNVGYGEMSVGVLKQSTEDVS
jgi:hypothetical protein